MPIAWIATAYSINIPEGSLSLVGEMEAKEILPKSITVDPKGQFAYVANYRTISRQINDNNDMNVYKIDPDKGTLSLVEKLPAQTQSTSVAIDPAGKFVYMTSDFFNFGYRIDPETGKLSEIVGENGKPRFQHANMTIDAKGKFIYVTNTEYNSPVIVYSIDPSNGMLTRSGEEGLKFNSVITSIVFDPKDKFACVANQNNSYIHCYKIDPTTNQIIKNSVVETDLILHPLSMVISPNGKSLFVLFQNSFYTFAINPDTLVLTKTDSVKLKYTAKSFALDPIGKFVYVTMFNGTNSFVDIYSINETSEKLTNLGMVQVGNIEPESITVDPSGRFVYVGVNQKIYIYNISRKKPLIKTSDLIVDKHNPSKLVYQLTCVTSQQIPESSFVFKGTKGNFNKPTKITLWGNNLPPNKIVEVESVGEYPNRMEFDKDIGEKYCAH
jgi:DNA-binding beta-propeller fold protein YncE